uniref:Uncharacterized protein n=1 Tax=Plectus sambesii TaxID=2011161 RepID=A0A914WKP7_9BILA
MTPFGDILPCIARAAEIVEYRWRRDVDEGACFFAVADFTIEERERRIPAVDFGQHLVEVLQQVDQVANLINDCVRDYDNSIKIVSVQKSLDAYAPKLLVPGRRLIKEGRL